MDGGVKRLLRPALRAGAQPPAAMHHAPMMGCRCCSRPPGWLEPRRTRHHCLRFFWAGCCCWPQAPSRPELVP
jgi:hypothetical protein